MPTRCGVLAEVPACNVVQRRAGHFNGLVERISAPTYGTGYMVRVTDDKGACAVQTVEVTVTDTNDVP